MRMPINRNGVWGAALAFVILAGGGCLPSRVMIDLAPSDGELLEKPVLSDVGAGAHAPKVALIDVSGIISQTPVGGLFTGGGNSVDRLATRLAKAERDPNVRAIILRINSPGGSVAASETMYEEIRRFREASEKPVIASMSEVAASGGYYIALASDHIIAQPTSVTGSIGVIIQTLNFSKGMERIGIEARSIKSGAMKDLANPLEPMREDQYDVLQSTVDEFYGAFVELVVERRGGALDTGRLDMLTDGRIFTGRTAHEHGLVDEIGGLREAFERAKEHAGLERAKMVKYHADGREPMSPYASAELGTNRFDRGTQLNLLQVNLPGGLYPTAGFYYLWFPSVP